MGTVTEAITPISGVITILISGRGTLCSNGFGSSFPPEKKGWKRTKHWNIYHLSHEKNLLIFDFSGCLIGILIVHSSL